MSLKPPGITDKPQFQGPSFKTRAAIHGAARLEELKNKLNPSRSRAQPTNPFNLPQRPGNRAAPQGNAKDMQPKTNSKPKADSKPKANWENLFSNKAVQA